MVGMMGARVVAGEDDETGNNWASVRVPGFWFPVATFDAVEDAEALVSDPVALAAATERHRSWVLASYDAATIARYHMIPRR